MVHIGVLDEGMADYQFKKRDDGSIVPDASVSEIHRIQKRQTRQQIEAACEADKLGYDYIIHSEHHFNLLSTNLPNPVLTQTAIAAQTEDIRFVQMANILPWYEPVRLAEQLAMLDIISDGRAEFGIGKGSSSVNSAILGQYWGGTDEDKLMNNKSFEEKYEILLEAWTEDFVSHNGQFHNLPPNYVEWENHDEYQYLKDEVSGHEPQDTMSVDLSTEKTTLSAFPVFPQPQQEPHPQIWKPAPSPGAMKWAARQGINACVHYSDGPVIKDLIDAYYDNAEAADWPDHRPEYDGEPFRHGWDADRCRGVVPIVRVLNTDVADEETLESFELGLERELKDDSEDMDVKEKIAGIDKFMVGSSDEIIDDIVDLRETCGYEDLAFFIQIDFTGMSQEAYLEQLRVFAEEVSPYFKEGSV